MSEPTTELAVRSDTTPARHNLDREVTDSWIEVVADVGKLAGYIADTEFVPRPLRGRSAAVAGVILYSREVGLPPMTGLAQTHVIEGKPSLSAEALRGLVFAAGHVIEFPETNGVHCVARGKRRGSENWTTVEWTIDQARAAGLLSKQNWKNHPRQMLQARASAELCRLIFPDVVHGMGAAEELTDAVDGDAPAEVEQPTSTVSRSRRARQTPTASRADQMPTPTPPKAESAAEGEQEVQDAAEIPLPESPAGPARVETPGPAEHEPTSEIPADLVEAAAQAPERDRPATVHKLRPEDAPKVSPGQLRLLGVHWSRLKVDDATRRDLSANLIGRELAAGTTKDLTQAEAKWLIDSLAKCETSDHLDDLVSRVLAERGDE